MRAGRSSRPLLLTIAVAVASVLPAALAPVARGAEYTLESQAAYDVRPDEGRTRSCGSLESASV